jgi:hypothetical protein
MFLAPEIDVSYAMLRHWGDTAPVVALGYAREHEKLGNGTTAQNWHNVTRLIVELREARKHVARTAAVG